MYVFMSYVVFVEAVGYASLLTEALLATPQLVKNYRSKSTVGMSQSMVLLWAGGDIFKLGYFLIKAVPIQFVVCGVIQITVDSLILAQISIYSPSRRRNLSRDEYKCTESLTRHSETKSKAWVDTQGSEMQKNSNDEMVPPLLLPPLLPLLLQLLHQHYHHIYISPCFGASFGKNTSQVNMLRTTFRFSIGFLHRRRHLPWLAPSLLSRAKCHRANFNSLSFSSIN